MEQAGPARCATGLNRITARGPSGVRQSSYFAVSVIADVHATPLPTMSSVYSTHLVAAVIVRVVSVVIIKAERDSDDSEVLFVMTVAVVAATLPGATAKPRRPSHR
jgi:hypothetical protein